MRLTICTRKLCILFLILCSTRFLTVFAAVLNKIDGSSTQQVSDHSQKFDQKIQTNRKVSDNFTEATKNSKNPSIGQIMNVISKASEDGRSSHSNSTNIKISTRQAFETMSNNSKPYNSLPYFSDIFSRPSSMKMPITDVVGSLFNEKGLKNQIKGASDINHPSTDKTQQSQNNTGIQEDIETEADRLDCDDGGEDKASKGKKSNSKKSGEGRGNKGKGKDTPKDGDDKGSKEGRKGRETSRKNRRKNKGKGDTKKGCKSNRKKDWSGEREGKEGDDLKTNEIELRTTIATTISNDVMLFDEEATLRPVQERLCPIYAPLPCIYGYCDTKQMECVCDPGYEGNLCHRKIGYSDDLSPIQISREPLPSGSSSVDTPSWMGGSKEEPSKQSKKYGGTESSWSSWDGDSSLCQFFIGYECLHGKCVSMYCECDEGWQGDACQLKAPAPKTTSNPETGPQDESDPWEPLNNYRPLQPVSQRRCPEDHKFICRYGNCTVSSNSYSENTSYISGNHLECQCEPDFSGKFCERHCALQCGTNAHCEVVYGDGAYDVCRCNDASLAWPGCVPSVYETVEHPTTKTSLFEEISISLAVSASFVGCLLLVLGIIFLVWRWRAGSLKQLTCCCFCHRDEDNDGREFDAFVCFTSSAADKDFVVKTLVPKLEGQMNFTLCLHQKDCLAGDFTSENVHNFLKKSRRAIIIVSPSFLSGDWSRFEYQGALQHMIKEKHRNILIVLADLSFYLDGIDNTLRKVIESSSYIRYPGRHENERNFELFWRRLTSMMPKSDNTREPV